MKQAIEYFLIVIDNSLDFVAPHDFINFHTIRFSDYQFNIPKNSGYFLSQPEIQNKINEISDGNLVAIIPFKPNSKVEHICKKNNWIYVANPSFINRHLEDKIEFAYTCDHHQIPTIPHLIAPFTPENFIKCQQSFNSSSLVIQNRHGWAGNSTHNATTYSDLSQTITPDTKVKFMPLLSGYTLLNNCCLYHSRLYQSPTALQFTGIAPLTLNPFTTVGRQWPSNAPDDVLKQVNEITHNFSLIIRDYYKYQGFFGLDFFVDQNNHVYLLECNPRLTASFAFYTNLELKASLLPLFYLHLDEFCHLYNYENIQNRVDNTSICGTELTVRDEQGITTHTYHYDHPLSLHPYDQITLP